MPRKLRIAYFVHSITSDWNNGNAHFLRGLARALGLIGHAVTCWEAENAWSRVELLRNEHGGNDAIADFRHKFPDLKVAHYTEGGEHLRAILEESDIAIVHEWHSPEFVADLLTAADDLPVRLLFHDTHHRASSSPAAIKLLQIERFDGVLAFGEALRDIYVNRFGLRRVWTFHEAADTSVFYPRPTDKNTDVVWVGNWGEDERTEELQRFLIEPARHLADTRWLVYGVRYPESALRMLAGVGIHYGGYLPNLSAPEIYRKSRITLHIPRQQYQKAMRGIPTIRMFEALAAGIPLIAAPWHDSEHLFRPGDYLQVSDSRQMVEAIRSLLQDPKAAERQALHGLETILSRHTCRHRAEELTQICEDVLA